MVSGCGGHPGTKRSGVRSPPTPSWIASDPAYGPPEIAQAPTAMRIFGGGTAAQVFSSARRVFGFTTPVVEAEPPTMDIGLSGTEITITWDRGVLESSATVDCSYTPVAGATSPYKPVIEGGQRFYRAKD